MTETRPNGHDPYSAEKFVRLGVGDRTGNFCEWAGDCRGRGGGRPSEGLRLDPSARMD